MRSPVLLILFVLIASEPGALGPPAGRGEARAGAQPQLSDAGRRRVEERLARLREEDERMFRLAHEADLEEAKVFGRTAAQRAAYLRRLREFAEAYPVDGHRAEVWGKYVGADGLYEGGVVQYHHPREGWRRYVTHEAAFDAAAQTRGIVQTPIGRALRLLEFWLPEDAQYTFSFQHGMDSDLNLYIRQVRFSDDNVLRGVIEFNEQGESYRAEFYGDDGRRIDGYYDPANEPKEEVPLPLAVPSAVRIATQPCEPCRGAAERRNELAREMDALASEIERVVNEYLKRRGAARPPLVQRHGVLLDQWLALSPRFDALHTELRNCTKACLTEQESAAVQPGAAPPAPVPPFSAEFFVDNRELARDVTLGSDRSRRRPREVLAGDRALTRDDNIGLGFGRRSRDPERLWSALQVLEADGTFRPLGLEDMHHAVGGSAPPDPAVQRMMSILDDMQEVLVIADGRGPNFLRGVGDVWRALAGTLSVVRTSVRSPGGSGELWVPPARRAGSQPASTSGSPLRMIVTSLGTSTGEAFRMHFINEGSRPIRISGGSLVVEPLRQDAQKRLQSEAQKLIRNGAQSLTVNGYCLEFLRQPPLPGTVFRVAGESLQREFAPARAIVSATRVLRNAGRLHPDSEPQGYYHAIRQWAIWTQEQGFTEATFADAFVEHTRKTLTASGRPWPATAEATLRKAAPGRWRDIQQVLAEAARR